MIGIRTRRSLHLAVIAIALAATGCSVKLVADYDEITDQAVTSLQRQVDRFFLQIERNIGMPEAEYSNFIDFYDDVRVDIGTIRVRAAARPRNEITVRQIDLLEANVDNLERLHKLGFSTAEELEPLKTAFHQGFRAILTLELAKKRGQ